MNLAYIDLMANNNNSILHQSSVISKSLSVFFSVLSVIFSSKPVEFFCIFVIITSGYSLSGISLKKMSHYALYPAFFSLLFAFFKFDVSLWAGFSIILRAVSSALILLLFISTTPYPELFALLNTLLPGIIVEGMFLTYRMLFIIMEEVQNFLVNIRLKGGYRPFKIIRNIKNLSGAIGVILLHAFDLSEKFQQILIIRGYSGRIKTDYNRKLIITDYLIIFVGIGVLVMVVII